MSILSHKWKRVLSLYQEVPEVVNVHSQSIHVPDAHEKRCISRDDVEFNGSEGSWNLGCAEGRSIALSKDNIVLSFRGWIQNDWQVLLQCSKLGFSGS